MCILPQFSVVTVLIYIRVLIKYDVCIFALLFFHSYPKITQIIMTLLSSSIVFFLHILVFVFLFSTSVVWFIIWLWFWNPIVHICDLKAIESWSMCFYNLEQLITPQYKPTINYESRRKKKRRNRHEKNEFITVEKVL